MKSASRRARGCRRPAGFGLRRSVLFDVLQGGWWGRTGRTGAGDDLAGVLPQPRGEVLAPAPPPMRRLGHDVRRMAAVHKFQRTPGLFIHISTQVGASAHCHVFV